MGDNGGSLGVAALDPVLVLTIRRVFSQDEPPNDA